MAIWCYKPNAIKEDLKKMQIKQRCICCGRILPYSAFWKRKTNPPIRRNYLELEQFDNQCKECYLKTIDNDNIDTILPVLKHFNVPYIETQWKNTCQYAKDRPGSVMGRYLSKMKLCAYYEFGFADSAQFNQKG